MTTTSRLSFAALAVSTFLLPIFFIPGGAIDPGSAQALLAVLGTGVAAALFLISLIPSREFSLPKHPLIWATLLLPIVYLLSSVLSTPSSLSLLGYNLEAGTFGSILLGAIVLCLAAGIFAEANRTLQATLALFGAFSLLALFAAVQVLTHGTALSLGVFSGSMGNPLGNWTDLAVAMGLLASLSMLAAGMLPMKGGYKAVLYVLFAVSAALLAVIHYAPAFILTLAASVFAFLYFTRVEKGFGVRGEGEQRSEEGIRGAVILPVILALVSILFLVNPVVSSGKHLGEIVSGAFGVANAEVRPTLSTTLSISKSVLSQQALFGSGPNTFTKDWLAYKPADINTTPFWAVEFPFGAGFVATQVASTGIVGSILWLAFFILLAAAALKALTHIPESRASRFALMSAMLVSLFLWSAAFFYTPSLALFLIAFLFSGALLASGRESGLFGVRTWRFADAPIRQVAIVFILAALTGLSFLGWKEGKKIAGAYHFNRAAALANTAGTPVSAIEDELVKATSYSPLDSYYLTAAQLEFSRAQAIAQSATGTPEENKAAFEEALSRSISAAQAATAVNPAGYGNWVTLGQIYAALVPKPLALDGAYESAQFAYGEAYKRNPANPALPLLLAQLELAHGNTDNARSYARNAIALKPDYPDAYLFLAQLEAANKNIPAAVNSAEALVKLLPDNVGAQFELGLLKYEGADYAGAEDAFRKALAISPDYANAKFYLALSLDKLGKKDEALAALEELKEANPGNADLDKAIEDVTKGASTALKR